MIKDVKYYPRFSIPETWQTASRRVRRQVTGTRSLVARLHALYKALSHSLPENDSRWALMWTHPFIKYPRQNWGTVSISEYKVQTLYSGTELK